MQQPSTAPRQGDELVATAHAMSPKQALSALGSDRDAGLDSALASARREQLGDNALREEAPPPWWRKLLAQFTELVILILLAAAVISGLLGEWVDALVILAIVALNGLLGYLQEARAERALAALRQLSTPMCRAVRGGRQTSIPARELVPGDIVELEAGDRVPADLRLVTAFDLRAEEAALTGESVPVTKDASAVLPRDTPLAERANMAFMGTVIAFGRGRALVVATGMATELGRIAALVQQGEAEPTPLQRRLAELGRVLVVVCLALVAAVFLIQLAQGRALTDIFFLAVGLAVAVVPEGLPAIVTMALALGLRRMVRRKAIIRKLPSVETLGAVTVICSDKTGTLTRNEMSVRALCTLSSLVRITGSGYAPEGRFRAPLRDSGEPEPTVEDLVALLESEDGGREVAPLEAPDISRALEVAAYCNSASLVEPSGGKDWSVLGDPTEGALLVAARKAGLSPTGPRILAEHPFDSERKRMSVLVESDNGPRALAKGAPESLLPLCDRALIDGRVAPIDEAERARITELSEALADRALRTLALAYRDDVDAAEGLTEERLIFVGLVGMIDPPREEVKAAIRRCREAGVRAVMITGDHPATALAIARELGIIEAGADAVTGARLDEAGDDDLGELAGKASVFARVTAEHKLKIVRALKRRGQVVAMTGDGVNDAPALKHADIGIAMGITGTEVTKEASAMVLADDNFTSIVSAVEEGRGIFDNIQKVVFYLLSCNAGELLFVLAATALGWPLPLLAIQILWINLVTDGLPALALGLEPPEPDIMQRPPRPPREPVITRSRGTKMLGFGVLMAAATLIAFYRGLHDPEAPSPELARSLAFCTLAYSQLLFAFSCRSQRFTMPRLGLTTNPSLLVAVAVSALLQIGAVTLPYVGDTIFRMAPHRPDHWLWIAGLALAPVSLVEIGKILFAPARSGAAEARP